MTTNSTKDHYRIIEGFFYHSNEALNNALNGISSESDEANKGINGYQWAVRQQHGAYLSAQQGADRAQFREHAVHIGHIRWLYPCLCGRRRIVSNVGNVLNVRA